MTATPEQTDLWPLSRLLEDLGARPDPDLTLGELIHAFGERGIGALMLFLGLLSALIGAVPGTTTVIGAPLLVITIQLVFRREELWMPAWALKKSFDRTRYRQAVGRIMKPLRMIERLSKPRLSILTGETSEVLIGIVCTILILILMLPLIFANLIPSLIIAAFGFGLTQRDGVAVLIGWLGLLAFTVFAWLAGAVVTTALAASWHWAIGLFG